jgi:hypothetical protein
MHSLLMAVWLLQQLRFERPWLLLLLLLLLLLRWMMRCCW